MLPAEFGLPDLVRPIHGLEHQHVVAGADGGEMLLVAEAHFGDGHPGVLAHGLQQQAVGLGAHGVGHQVVRALEVDGVDLGEVHEGGDLDGVSGRDRHRVDLGGGQDHVVVLLDLVAAHDVGQVHLLSALGAEPSVGDAAVVRVVELMEAHALLFGGQEGTHRHGHQPERDGPFPHDLHGRLLVGVRLYDR